MPDTNTSATTTTTNAPPPPAAGGAAPTQSALGGAATQTTETKPAAGAETKTEGKQGETKTEGDKKAGETKPPEAKPLTFPKGFESHGELFTSTAKELGLEGEKAQKFADAFGSIHAAQSKALDTAAAAQESKWLEESKADPDIGGAKWDASMKNVNRALSKFGGPMVDVGDKKVPQVAVLLERAGLGNNKHILKAFALVGDALKDDSIQGTEQPAPKKGERVPDHVALYGDSKKP